MKIVEETWKSDETRGSGSFVLKEKMKKVKVRLREWHGKELGGLNDKIEELVLKIEE